MKKNIQNIGKGVVVGGSMLLPGLSGSTMAILLGVYDQLIETVSKFPKMGKENIKVLINFLIGGVLGILLFANPILILTENFTNPMNCLYIGAIVGGLPTLYKKSQFSFKQWKIQHIFYVLFGIGITTLMSVLDAKELFDTTNDSVMGFIVLMLAGTLCAIALVLPGISMSYVLLLFGMFESVLEAIKGLDILYLLPIGLGAVFGVLSTAKVLERSMKIHPTPTYLLIFGFLAGSLIELIPESPTGLEWIVCPIMLAIGFVLIFFVLPKEA